jgi:hypothetical protein
MAKHLGMRRSRRLRLTRQNHVFFRNPLARSESLHVPDDYLDQSADFKIWTWLGYACCVCARTEHAAPWVQPALRLCRNTTYTTAAQSSSSKDSNLQSPANNFPKTSANSVVGCNYIDKMAWEVAEISVLVLKYIVIAFILQVSPPVDSDCSNAYLPIRAVRCCVRLPHNTSPSQRIPRSINRQGDRLVRSLLLPPKASSSSHLSRPRKVWYESTVARKLKLYIYQHHLKGSVIRHGPNKLVFNSQKALHGIQNRAI